MNYFRLLLIIFSIGILTSSCDSWFDFTCERWELEPQYISNESLYFGEESNSQILYISNNGEHSQISFSITVSDKWLVPSTTIGTINKNEDKSININVNRKYLPEGENTGLLSVLIENNLWEIPVTATGANMIEISPQYINFGSNDDVAYVKIRSLSGSRDIEITPSSEWLSVSEKEFRLTEYDSNLSETEKTIGITCKRSLLEEGDYTSSVEVMSGLGAKLFSIPLSVTVPSQDPLTIAIDNYVFTLSKHLYWENNNVVLELKIKNHKYLKTFELMGSDSYALANDTKYSINSSYLSIQPNSEKTMRIEIEDVDKSVNTFKQITLAFRDLSKTVVFQNVELQK